jgi:FkbM family methyltransferase
MPLIAKARGALRRLASLPLRLLDAQTRSQAIELLVDDAIADVDVSGTHLRFFAPSALLRARAAGLQQKEPDMIAWLDSLPADAVLWDVGANVGVFSLYAAATRHCTVLAFEPSAPNFYVLTRNIQLNQFDSQVLAYCVALAGTTELGVLNLDSAQLGAALSQFGDAGDVSRYAGRASHLVHGMVGFSIDDFVARFSPSFPTHLKIDVDGLEWPIIQGAIRTLSDSRLQSVMIELSLTDRAERDRAIAVLAEAGLLFVSSGVVQGHAGEQAANHLFVRR